MLARIGKLYEIEADIRGQPPDARRSERQVRSRPLAEALHAWLEVQVTRVSGKSSLAEAIRYALRHWKGLVVFLDDGRVEIDTNPVERAIRRWKQVIGDELRAQSDERRATEVAVAVHVLNRMLELERPDYPRVAISYTNRR